MMEGERGLLIGKSAFEACAEGAEEVYGEAPSSIWPASVPTVAEVFCTAGATFNCVFCRVGAPEILPIVPPL